ncbi:uncharacterized protein LOC116655052 isoform X1 [Drosophila ananassae]|uniref:uncharacterized protein LOC116655052 isoform X1 n=1 Tax=Drosophila ananassae TaxID=7217 RepID=UPI0013A5F0FE|nr:uncharacterized protein LOC116655052 isoform X1 [Drosophila ananassae]
MLGVLKYSYMYIHTQLLCTVTCMVSPKYSNSRTLCGSFARYAACMTEEITGNWGYYVYISLTLVPVYLAFRLIKSLGWQLFVNN